MLFGGAVVFVGLKVQELIKGGPQKMQQMMMEQMMKQAMGGAGGPGGAAGASPFGMPGAGAGANPFGMPGAGMPGGFGAAGSPFGAAGGFGATPPSPAAGAGGAAGQTVDVTAKAAPATPPPTAAPASSSTTPTAAAAGATSPPPLGAEPAAPAAAAPAESDATTVEGEVKPAESAAATAEPAKSVFGDIDPEAEKARAEQAANVPPAGGGTFFADPPPMPPPGMPGMPPPGMPGMGAAGATGGDSSGGGMFSMDTIEKLLEDPKVQEMVYPYLPEGMRNPDTFKWMMSNPAYRSQMEEMLTNMSTDDLQQMGGGNFDMNSPEVKSQFDAMGTSPEDVIKKIMADPELAMSFQKPNVQSAIMDCSNNPANYMKYVNDAEVMEVFSKMQELFPQAPNTPMPEGMPPMPGGMPPMPGGMPPMTPPPTQQ